MKEITRQKLQWLAWFMDAIPRPHDADCPCWLCLAEYWLPRYEVRHA